MLTSTELAERLENRGNVGGFLVLLDSEDNIIDARLIDTRYGTKWLVADHEVDRIGRKWIPVDDSDSTFDGHGRPRRSTVQKDLGVRQAWQLDRAKVVKTWGGEYGPWIVRTTFVDGRTNNGVYTWDPAQDDIINPEMMGEEFGARPADEISPPPDDEVVPF